MQTIVVCLSVCPYLCLSRDVLSSCVRLSVRLSVLTIRYCIETTGQIELGFLAWRLFSHILHCVITKFGKLHK